MIAVADMNAEAQIRTLRAICEKLASLGDDWLEDNADALLEAIVGTLDDQSQDDAWGTEGWEHFFGLE